MHSPLPFAALLFNAFVWGLAWWPFQHMHQAGLHPLWATACMYAVVLLALLAWRPGILQQVRAHPQLWLLALASGLNNVAFNWAVTIGDVVRVILLFYLMPAWAVLLAWKVLGERPTPGRRCCAWRWLSAAWCWCCCPRARPHRACCRTCRWPTRLALLGGFMFALTNVTLRRLHTVPGPARMFSMFGGCHAHGAGRGQHRPASGRGRTLPRRQCATWVVTGLLLAGVLMLGNWALQFGAGAAWRRAPPRW